MRKPVIYSVPDSRLKDLPVAQQAEVREAFKGWQETTLRRYWFAKGAHGWEGCEQPIHTGAPQ